MDWTELHTSRKVRCPYCVQGVDFRLMEREGASDCYICGRCGHRSLASPAFYQCRCKKCCTLERKTRLWSGASLPVAVPRRGLFNDFHVRLRLLSRRFLRIGA